MPIYLFLHSLFHLFYGLTVKTTNKKFSKLATPTEILITEVLPEMLPTRLAIYSM